jgi:hypothetical protein
MMVAVILAALALSYVSSYYHLSRRGMREASIYGIDGFFYVPFSEITAKIKAGEFPFSKNYALRRWYAPLNWIDRMLFGGKVAASSFSYRLSG